ncbi:MAG: baseplate J/gp47 family protein [Cytophagales bacterium]|nr:baseplate J/gp47 family protein [Cytophagales bacterium]
MQAQTQHRDGVSQYSRFPDSLGESYVRVEERNLQDFLLYLRELAGHVKFFDSENKASGTWKFLFESDSLLFLSEILGTDARRLDQMWRSHIASIHIQSPYSYNQAHVQSQIRLLNYLFHQVNDWEKRSRRISDRLMEEIHAELYHLIHSHYSVLLNQYLGVLEQLVKNEMLSVDYLPELERFDKVWHVNQAYQLTGEIDKESFRLSSKNLTSLLNRLKLLYDELWKHLSYILERSRFYFDKTIRENSTHSPDIALLIAFLLNCEHVKRDLNAYTKRHLEYYFKNVLQQAKREPEGDYAFVEFELADFVSDYFLPESSRLVAGATEEGEPIVYETEESIEINKVKIEEIKRLFVSKNIKFSYSTNGAFQVISQVYKSENVANGGIDEEAEKELLEKEPWALFGSDQAGLLHSDRTMEEAEIGFAVSSPVFMMSGGKRRAEIVFKFDLHSMSGLVDVLEDISRKEKVRVEQAFHHLYRNSLKIFYSTESGWKEVWRYFLLPPNDWLKGEFTLVVDFPASYPSFVVSPDAEFGFSDPAFKILLNTQEAIYPYSFFKGLVLEEIRLKVMVKGLNRFEAFNELGRVDMGQPFAPFGALVKKGAQFFFGNAELFCKPLSELSFNFSWAGLPEKGFRHYFKDYGKPVSNELFKGSLSALSHRTFFPGEDPPEFSLFESKENTDQLKNWMSLKRVPLDKLRISVEPELKELELYHSNTRTGYFKLELTGPSWGFGNDIYPGVFARKSSEFAQSNFSLFGKKKKKEEGDNIEDVYPYKPYVPSLKEIRADYVAETVMNFDQIKGPKLSESFGQIAHIMPFGYQNIFKNGQAIKRELMPDFKNEGNLFIGLSGVEKESVVSLCFYVGAGKDVEAKKPKVSWYFLDEESWLPVPAKNILSDTTMGLSKSGIVRLRLPAVKGRSSTQLPTGLYWLSVQASGNIDSLPPVVRIGTQAVKARWKGISDGSAKWGSNIKAGSIASFEEKIPEIQEIRQPSSSFGGVLSEADTSFYARVSEKLRHKHRAVTSWDVERLILEHFPFVGQAKCLDAFESKDLASKGTSLVVVMPKREPGDDEPEPKLSRFNLDKIENYLKGFSSAFARYKVVNPSYEKIKVRAKLQLADGLNQNTNNYYIRQIGAELRKWIAPWQSDPGKKVPVGGKLDVEHLYRFLKSNPYVKFLTAFSVVQIFRREGKYMKKDTVFMGSRMDLAASSPVSVLVSVNDHDLQLIEKGIHESPSPSGLENMDFDTDFIVEGELSVKSTKDSGSLDQGEELTSIEFRL